MGKNLLVLGMSTLPIRRDNEEIISNKCCWESLSEKAGSMGESRKEIEYYSQLEPVSKMIMEREKNLDKIIIFATPETQKKVRFQYQEQDKNESAVDFYLSRMEGVTQDQVLLIDVTDNNFIEAIFKAVEAIRKFWKENKTEDPKLWIDTQGGFRNLNLVINAIISLLKNDKIVPSGIYSIKYIANSKEPNPIQDQTQTYRIFDFVSGINEFSRYGRAEQLEDYYKSTGEKVALEPIGMMKTIVENIQMCDMESFDCNLAAFRNYVKEKKDGDDNLLDIFWTQIKDDYGKLLEDSCTGLDIIEWLYKKKFYQQAITYIESKMPKEWVSKGIIRYGTSESTLNTIKNSAHKNYERNDNFVISQIAFECFIWTAIMDKKTKKSNIKKPLKWGRNQRYMKEFPENKIDVTVTEKKDKERKERKKIGEICNIQIDSNKYDNIMDMLLLYKLLKNERNNFNHMSDSSLRADQNTLGQAIRMFIECGRKVYE